MNEDGLPTAAPAMPEFLDRIGQIYGNSLWMRGPTSLGVGWSTELAQLRRFEILLRLLDQEPEGGKVTVNDLGCGYGALWPHLAEMSRPQIGLYTGYDISTEMIEQARRLHQDKRTRFLLGSVADEPADYGFVSGTFNFREKEDAKSWRLYVGKALVSFAGQCRKGIGFNMLHARSPRRLKSMYYADPTDFEMLARGLLVGRGGRVEVVDDYLEEDFTVLVRFETP